MGGRIQLKDRDRVAFVNMGISNFSTEKMAALEGVTQE